MSRGDTMSYLTLVRKYIGSKLQSLQSLFYLVLLVLPTCWFWKYKNVCHYGICFWASMQSLSMIIQVLFKLLTRSLPATSMLVVTL